MSIDWILKRRSIRRYTDTAVPGDTIRMLLEAGMAAPSARNAQPWHFVVVTDTRQLKALAEAHPYGGMLAHAPLAIAVVGEPALSAYWIQDCSAATENILIAASSLGLGSVWLGVTPRQDRIDSVGGVLSIPAGLQVLSLIALGFPNEDKAPRTQYRDDRIHHDRW